MAIYKEKSTANTGVLARIFDAVDSHFGPTLRAAPKSRLSSLKPSSLTSSQVGCFRLAKRDLGAVKTHENDEFRPPALLEVPYE